MGDSEGSLERWRRRVQTAPGPWWSVLRSLDAPGLAGWGTGAQMNNIGIGRFMTLGQPSRVSAHGVVLIVDDDPDIRDALRDTLEWKGYAVAEATDGADAIAYLRGHPPPRAILLDLFMPMMDGWHCFDRIRSLPELALIPVFVVTATGSRWGYPNAPVFRKPVDVPRLLEALARLSAPGDLPAC
jgi:CheY-like chemotaxis protein